MLQHTVLALHHSQLHQQRLLIGIGNVTELGCLECDIITCLPELCIHLNLALIALLQLCILLFQDIDLLLGLLPLGHTHICHPNSHLLLSFHLLDTDPQNPELTIPLGFLHSGILEFGHHLLVH